MYETGLCAFCFPAQIERIRVAAVAHAKELIESSEASNPDVVEFYELCNRKKKVDARPSLIPFL